MLMLRRTPFINNGGKINQFFTKTIIKKNV